MAANRATNGDGLLLDILKVAPKEDAANGGMVVPPAALKNSAVTTTTTTQEDSAPRMEPEDQLDSGERRLNELGYKQELRREMVLLLLQGLNVPELVVANCFCGRQIWCWGFVVVVDDDEYDEEELLWDGCADTLQVHGNRIFHHDTVYRHCAFVWKQLHVCRTSGTSVGMGCCHILHLVCGLCHVRNLLLFSCKIFHNHPDLIPSFSCCKLLHNHDLLPLGTISFSCCNLA